MIEHHNENISSNHPVMAFIQQLLTTALAQSVSDIHLEPQEHNFRIRCRRDGILHAENNISNAFATQVIASLKIMAQLDITEKRLPQDGRIQLPTASTLNIRISTCPTLFGEKVALRLLDNQHQYLNIDALGFTNEQQKLFLEKLTQPQGLIILTGPTGSGKTSTLYSALQYLNNIDKNLITIEDPIEIKLSGILQIQVNNRIKLTFAHLLRSILRQDPDVIMIGEIRDAETAAIALQAAQTGHLVLSTLHCENAQEVIPRLEILNINPYYLQSALSLVIAQRLVRKICQHCQGKLSENSHCQYCHAGYSGRSGIFELSTCVNQQLHTPLTLRQAGLLSVEQGITDQSELKRVLGDADFYH